MWWHPGSDGGWGRAAGVATWAARRPLCDVWGWVWVCGCGCVRLLRLRCGEVIEGSADVRKEACGRVACCVSRGLGNVCLPRVHRVGGHHRVAGGRERERGR